MSNTFLRSVADQLRMHATSPVAILGTLALPCVFAFVIHSNRTDVAGSPGTTSDLAVSSAGIGILDSAIVLVVLSLLGEKQWKTLYAALGSPGGLVPLVLGRLTGIAVQTLVAVPGTFAVLALLWGLDGTFAWGRWLAGGALLTLATTAVVGLLAVAVLRFPYSSGMVNGLSGLVMALSALVVPQSALPAPVQAVSQLLPQAHVMAWVRGGPAGDVAVALALTAVYAAVVVLLVRRVEHTARRRAVPMEV
ncbi:ABC transporter permease [Streptomyces sp. NPDC035033]|uniref:ABC transporter permease n=1 Tax=Streptomyces sp. NPDC035033 TaxID=3155368 RepID=UPI0033D8064D